MRITSISLKVANTVLCITKFYCARHLLVQAQCPATSQAESTADGCNERLLNEVLASRLRHRTLTIVRFQAFIGCGLLLGLTMILPCMCIV